MDSHCAVVRHKYEVLLNKLYGVNFIIFICLLVTQRFLFLLIHAGRILFGGNTFHLNLN